VAPGEDADPYRVWLSEIMLQQTTVKAVGPYYLRFLAQFPSVTELAEADIEDVLKLWAGLGYYARAHHLHACAKAVAARGAFPDREEELKELPGVGPYTAAAIAAIAFDRKASPVDGNVERVVTRLFAIEQQLPNAKPAIRRLAADLTPARRPGDFAHKTGPGKFAHCAQVVGHIADRGHSAIKIPPHNRFRLPPVWWSGEVHMSIN